MKNATLSTLISGLSNKLEQRRLKDNSSCFWAYFNFFSCQETPSQKLQQLIENLSVSPSINDTWLTLCEFQQNNQDHTDPLIRESLSFIAGFKPYFSHFKNFTPSTLTWCRADTQQALIDALKRLVNSTDFINHAKALSLISAMKTVGLIKSDNEKYSSQEFLSYLDKLTPIDKPEKLRKGSFDSYDFSDKGAQFMQQSLRNVAATASNPHQDFFNLANKLLQNALIISLEDNEPSLTATIS